MITFTDQIHQAAAPFWQKSFEHPFIHELQAGTLPKDVFRYYLIQDRYYLSEFGKLHELIAEQVDDAHGKQFLLDGAQGLKDGEIAVREGFFEQLGITPDEVASTPIAPTAYNYVNHMYAELYRGTPQQAIAGLLPCYWLYNQIGQHLVAQGSPVKLYQRWIETYDSDDYTDSVDQMIALTNRSADQADAALKGKMKTAFVRSSAYELAFWQMALDQQKWQVTA
ncbi:thiaminase II [Secundilactobacillus pentosiphilus]|uniref:Aminopyrimidine aminohydrolase n=1 Tax=Secundilactobacillus pentosiphilus TaxID=1714682 RepID=A0A1Z5IPW0_9LACO|nr:thiaminase II [Secundilactobacillus pentosiphilus]GAX03658.1 thiaminase II [Secundilactobacillus pentosiphilus]